jgi:uncharacterized protein
VRHLRHWLKAEHLRLQVRGVAVLHDAPPEITARLRTAADRLSANHEIGMVGAPDLTRSATELSKLLLTDDLQPLAADGVRDFLDVEHHPSERLLARLDDVVNGDRAFDLVGSQQDAYVTVREKIEQARQGGRHLIIVTGGPGTGKSVVAVRLLAAISRSGLPARYVTPSGTLRRQLLRAVTTADAAGLFAFLSDHVARKPEFAQVSLVDEAQRMKSSGNYLKRLMSISRVCVLFLDERQIIRPDEGITLAECEATAAQLGIPCHHVELAAQFRCAGSLDYLNWLEDLLFAEGRPAATSGYDIGLSQNPEDLADWVRARNSEGRTARIAAGFCWGWPPANRSRPLNNDVSIPWTDTNGRQWLWERPWNALEQRTAGNAVIAPRREFWATDEGGQDQVGCIYTCQGLEYDHAGVIIGPDFVRRDGQWEGRPEYSKDPAFPKDISPAEYTRFAANIYYVLASRGTRGCRLYSTDEQTQEYLASLLDPAR